MSAAVFNAACAIKLWVNSRPGRLWRLRDLPVGEEI